MTLLNVWAGGLWIILALPILAALISLIKAIAASKSGSSQQIPGQGTVYSNQNVPITKTSAFKFFIGFMIVAAIIYFWVTFEG